MIDISNTKLNKISNCQRPTTYFFNLQANRVNLISLAPRQYLENLNPFGSGRWPNSTIRLTQIWDRGRTR
jgi:hypothetical protein